MKRTFYFTLLLSAMMGMAQMAGAQTTYGVTTEADEQNTPEGWTAVSLPNINSGFTGNRLVKITDYGASIESEDNHTAIQNAIDALPSRGGVVIIPRGTWMTGAFTLKSKTILHLEKGATLMLLDMNTWKDGSTPLISCRSNATDVIVEGEDKDSCVIDGQGADWWAVRDIYGKSSTQWSNLKRPGIIDFQMGSQRFLIKNLTIKDSPTSNIRIGKNNKGMHATIHDVIIREPASELKYSASNPYGKNPSHNTDGIPVWTKFVNIYNCDISNGDDNVVMDTGAQFVHIWNCQFGTGHGASMGSYTSNLHDILWENITFDGTSAGFRLKSNVNRSGSVYNITMRNCTMTNTGCPISMTAWYDSEPSLPATKQDSTSTTPYYHDILIQNVKASNLKSGSESVHMFGRPESYISNVTLDNVQVKAPQGMFLAYVRGLKFVNGCNLATTSGSYFKRKYEASFEGSYNGDDASGIKAVNADEVNANGAWYDINGRKVNDSNLHNGVFIHNGKKIVKH